ncbi:hypothetical protein MMC25_004319 [Agyrium rufum]|nr:hypothetical protein [Agyrium rufum]
MTSTTTQTSSHVNGASKPKYTLYTNHFCPWAQRAHIVADELKIPFEEVHIDLGKPREEWYLKVNPRGLVPALAIEDPSSSEKPTIVLESGIISTYLADLYGATGSEAKSFYPPSTTVAGALARATMTFFVDTWFTKVQPTVMELLLLSSQEEREQRSSEIVAKIKQHIEPEPIGATSAGEGPFWGGSQTITLVEALTGSFLLRLQGLIKADYLSSSIIGSFQKETPKFSKWLEATCADPSVKGIWNEKAVVESTIGRYKKLAADKAAKAA